jgi:hypothetical protein
LPSIVEPVVMPDGATVCGVVRYELLARQN